MKWRPREMLLAVSLVLVSQASGCMTVGYAMGRADALRERGVAWEAAVVKVKSPGYAASGVSP